MDRYQIDKKELEKALQSLTNLKILRTDQFTEEILNYIQIILENIPLITTFRHLELNVFDDLENDNQLYQQLGELLPNCKNLSTLKIKLDYIDIDQINWIIKGFMND